jgi:hypothetical protein
MSDINYFKIFVLCKMIWQMMWNNYMWKYKLVMM